MSASEQNEIRANMHGMWAKVAPSWGEHAEFVDTRATEETERLLELAALQPGERVLELACGAGGLGLAAAATVGPEGEVVLSDVAAEMTVIAATRASAAGIDNVSTAVIDIERIDQPDGSFDAVVSRHGLMFALEPDEAAREIVRVLRPGGRAALSVWGPREENPWLGLVLDAASRQLGAPMPPPGVPGPFALPEADRLERVLADSGLDDVQVNRLSVPLKAPSEADWWTRTVALAGPLARVLDSLPAEAATAIRSAAEEGAQAYRTTDGLEFPGVALLASGRLS
jgi:ubiquinone/menaquinone biosynthesis C-methylase UbiE